MKKGKSHHITNFVIPILRYPCVNYNVHPSMVCNLNLTDLLNMLLVLDESWKIHYFYQDILYSVEYF